MNLTTTIAEPELLEIVKMAIQVRTGMTPSDVLLRFADNGLEAVATFSAPVKSGTYPMLSKTIRQAIAMIPLDEEFEANRVRQVVSQILNRPLDPREIVNVSSRLHQMAKNNGCVKFMRRPGSNTGLRNTYKRRESEDGTETKTE